MGRGETVAEIAASTRQVAEGVKSCEAILELAAAADADMPIVEHVVAVVRGEMTPLDMMNSLLARDVKAE